MSDRPTGIRRLFGLSSKSSQLHDSVELFLAQDPMWQVFTVDHRWVCPYCLTVLKTPADDREMLIRTIAKHLTSCERYQEGRCHHQEAVIRQALRENISWYLQNDPAWGVTDAENDTWWCPLTLKNIPTVTAKNGRFR